MASVFARAILGACCIAAGCSAESSPKSDAESVRSSLEYGMTRYKSDVAKVIATSSDNLSVRAAEAVSFDLEIVDLDAGPRFEEAVMNAQSGEMVVVTGIPFDVTFKASRDSSWECGLIFSSWIHFLCDGNRDSLRAGESLEWAGVFGSFPGSSPGTTGSFLAPADRWKSELYKRFGRQK